MLTVEKALHGWGQRAYGKISVLFAQFYCEPKRALKKFTFKN